MYYCVELLKFYTISTLTIQSETFFCLLQNCLDSKIATEKVDCVIKQFLNRVFVHKLINFRIFATFSNDKILTLYWNRITMKSFNVLIQTETNFVQTSFKSGTPFFFGCLIWSFFVTHTRTHHESNYIYLSIISSLSFIFIILAVDFVEFPYWLLRRK